MEEKYPLIKIIDRPGKPIAIRVFHYGHIPNILNQFPDAVLRRAVNKGRTREEHRILKAARGLSRTAYRIVEQHVIYQRALKVQDELWRKNLRAIRVRRFPRQQNSRLSIELPGTCPTFSSASVCAQQLTLTERLARDVGAEPYTPSRSTPSRSRGR
ncbi:MAG: hypothetical protein JSR99_12205 [Proteobacteria bacterium]|nr:hypothetical protein [Pseudomonadota bacterium]